ncbi:hypothetical protein Bca52824_000793 [Brassica carinata]|uniref:Uncharacterized protein n=1 Tax=Brassica carinata TaxID=52824 RepID=A0A8X7WEY8_BRACI|nr:hypothetical protein Bca52824_000793 [Brassica carinata]
MKAIKSFEISPQPPPQLPQFPNRASMPPQPLRPPSPSQQPQVMHKTPPPPPPPLFLDFSQRRPSGEDNFLCVSLQNAGPDYGLGRVMFTALEALVKMMPTKEEELKLCSYKGVVDELGSAKNILRALVGVPFAFQRAEAMMYRDV